MEKRSRVGGGGKKQNSRELVLMSPTFPLALMGYFSQRNLNDQEPLFPCSAQYSGRARSPDSVSKRK